MFSFFKSGFQKIQQALAKTRSLLESRIREIFSKPLDNNTLQELEKILYEADLGSLMVEQIMEQVRGDFKGNHSLSAEKIIEKIRAHCHTLLQTIPPSSEEDVPLPHPLVILIVGANGSGKTTSIAKLAKLWQNKGKRVLIAAADTFRAAATEQLESWALRLDVDYIKGKKGSDPSSIVFDALQAAKARNHDVVIIDTAGRLHNKTDLMRELEKMRRTANKAIPNAPHETFLVLDATIGQHAIDQARAFHSFTPLTGMILTKLDGSAKGGIALAICHKMALPIRWIGIGEKEDDLIPFDAEAYLKALFN